MLDFLQNKEFINILFLTEIANHLLKKTEVGILEKN